MSSPTKELPSLATPQRDDLMKMTLPVLRSLGKSNNIYIPTRLSKSLAVDRLLEGDSGQRTPARRAHKGPRTPSSPIKRITLSSLRARRLMASGPPSDITSPGHLSTGRILPISWALAVQDLVEKMDSQQNSTPSSLESGCVQPPGPWRAPVPVQVPSSDFDRSRRLVVAETSVRAPLASSVTVSRWCTDHLAVTAPQGSLSAGPSQQCGPIPSVQEVLHDTYTLTLAGGYVLQYSEADFQDIPSTSGVFSDASRLAAVWDDASPLWGKKEYSPLIVRNISIAIKHWKRFYRQFQKVEHQKCWNSWRQNWYNYQDLMVEYQSLGEAVFKEKWSNALCSSKILSALRGRRKQDWDQLAQAARLEYPGEAFDACFTYKKQGKWIVPRKPKAIARRYLVLKGIPAALN